MRDEQHRCVSDHPESDGDGYEFGKDFVCAVCWSDFDSDEKAQFGIGRIAALRAALAEIAELSERVCGRSCVYAEIAKAALAQAAKP